ncbi:2427_t:CDS:2, partial [Diversispora eburnea]
LNQHSLELKTDIEQRFRLTNIRELATDRTPLLSFMFYTGALTYKPGSLKYELQIPNRIAKREFIAEALKIYDWKEEDLMSVRNDNSVKHSNEEALKQAFMDALILTLHADIEPEFRVHTQNLSRKAIDLVKTSTGRRIAIEFDNIKTECVKLNGVTNSWQELTQVSRLLSEKSDEEILSLEISDKYRPKQKTVREVLEHKIKVKKNEYLMPLKERNDAELSSLRKELNTITPECDQDLQLFESDTDIGLTLALQNKDTSSSAKNAIEPTSEICS